MERVNASSASVPLAHITAPEAYKQFMHDKTRKQESEKSARKHQRSRLAPVPQPMHAADQSSSKSVNENFTSAARKLTSLSGFRGQDIFDPRLERASEGGLGIRGWGSSIPWRTAPSRRARLRAQRKDKRREIETRVCSKRREVGQLYGSAT